MAKRQKELITPATLGNRIAPTLYNHPSRSHDKMIMRKQSTIDPSGGSKETPSPHNSLLSAFSGGVASEVINFVRLISASRRNDQHSLELAANNLQGHVSGFGTNILIKMLSHNQFGDGAAIALQGVTGDEEIHKIAKLAQHEDTGIASRALTALQSSNSPIVSDLFSRLLQQPIKYELRSAISKAIAKHQIPNEELLISWARSFNSLSAPAGYESSRLTAALVKSANAAIITELASDRATISEALQTVLEFAVSKWPDQKQKLILSRHLISSTATSKQFCQTVARALFSRTDPDDLIFALQRCNSQGSEMSNTAWTFSNALFDQIAGAAEFGKMRSTILGRIAEVPGNLSRILEANATTHMSGSDSVSPLSMQSLANLWRNLHLNQLTNGALCNLARRNVLSRAYYSRNSRDETLEDLGFKLLEILPGCNNLLYCELPKGWVVKQTERSSETLIHDGFGIARMAFIHSPKSEPSMISCDYSTDRPNPESFDQLPDGTFKIKYLAELVSNNIQTHIAILSEDGRMAEYGAITPGGSDYLNLTLDYGGKKKLTQDALDSGKVRIRTLSKAELDKRPRSEDSDDDLELGLKIGMPYGPRKPEHDGDTHQKENASQQELENRFHGEQIRAQQTQILLNWLNAVRQRELRQDHYLGLDR